MPLAFREENIPISRKELETFENAYGLDLPEDYRVFLLSTNGGSPEIYHSVDFLLDDQPNSTLIDIVFGVTNEKYVGFAWILDMYAGRLPDNLLPIAADAGHSLVVLSVAGEDKGRVYFWDGDWEVTDGTPDYSNVHLIASSFAEFVDMVKKV